MLTFVVRRLIGLIAVMFALSVQFRDADYGARGLIGHVKRKSEPSLHYPHRALRRGCTRDNASRRPILSGKRMFRRGKTLLKF